MPFRFGIEHEITFLRQSSLQLLPPLRLIHPSLQLLPSLRVIRPPLQRMPTLRDLKSDTAAPPADANLKSDTAAPPADADLKTDAPLVPPAEDLLQQASSARQKAAERIDTVAAAIKNINLAYHPFNLQSGEAVSPKAVEQILQQQFSMIERIAGEAELSLSAIKRIQKAKRVLSKMIATLTFFPQGERTLFNNYCQGNRLDVRKRSPRDSSFTINSCHLLGPLLKKNNRPNTDAQLTELSSQLLSKVNARDGPLGTAIK